MNKEAVRESNRRRAGCPKCGSNNVEFVDGSKCDGFSEIVYKRCLCCGDANATKQKPKKK